MHKFFQKRWVRTLTHLAVVIAILWTVRGYMLRSMASGEAPPFTVADLNGQMLSPTNFSGRPVLLHFWATWCPVCRLEQDSIASIARDHAVVTVATQSGDGQSVSGYLRKHNLHSPVVLDEQGILAKAYGVKAVPASFVVDGDGVIRFVEVGYTTEWGLRLRLWLAGFW